MAELNARIIAKASATSGEAPLAGDLEVAEIAVNTADGKFFTKHTDGTVKEISGSGGGGGGAVDSVNGQTGVVELNIFDLNDVDYKYTSIGWAWIATDEGTASSGLPDGNAIGTTLQLSVSPISSDGDDVKAALRAWSAANPIPYDTTFSVDGVETAVTIEGYEDNLDNTGAYNPRLRLGTAAGGTPAAPVGSVITLPDFDAWANANGYARDDAASLPLSEGDILQWNDADQKFKPAQIPGGAVDSVNGETGVVSLGIQEMDDFETGPVAAYDDVLYALAPANANAPGKVVINNALFTSAVFYRLGADGSVNLYDEALSAQDANGNSWDGVKVWMSFDGGPYQEFDVDSVSNSNNNPSIRLAPPYVYPAGHSDISVTFSRPLMADCILEWNETAQKFSPASISVNNKRGDISLGIQDMDDFQYAFPSNPATAFQYDTVFENGNPNDTGEARVWASGTALQANEYDSIGNTSFIDAAIAAKTAQPSNTPIWTRTNNDAWVERTCSVGTDPAIDGGYMSFSNVSPAVVGNPSSIDTFYIAFGNPPTQKLPLAEGDILQWNNTDQKFKPAQLPTSGGGDPDPTLFDTWYQFDDGNITITGAPVNAVGKFKMYNPTFNIPELEVNGLASSDNTGATDVNHSMSALPDYSVLWFQAFDPSSGVLGPIRIAAMTSIFSVNSGNTQFDFYSMEKCEQVYNDVASIGLGLRIGVYLNSFVTKAQLKDVVADSSDFADFQSRIAAL